MSATSTDAVVESGDVGFDTPNEVLGKSARVEGYQFNKSITRKLLKQWVDKTVEQVEETPKNRFRPGPKNIKTSRGHGARLQ